MHFYNLLANVGTFSKKKKEFSEMNGRHVIEGKLNKIQSSNSWRSFVPY